MSTAENAGQPDQVTGALVLVLEVGLAVNGSPKSAAVSSAALSISWLGKVADPVGDPGVVPGLLVGVLGDFEPPQAVAAPIRSSREAAAKSAFLRLPGFWASRSLG